MIFLVVENLKWCVKMMGVAYDPDIVSGQFDEDIFDENCEFDEEFDENLYKNQTPTVRTFDGSKKGEDDENLEVMDQRLL